ncbi:hypothetical protein BDV93DRAFT_512867 [Ceratobasidium sp. AG-I]|nr:hypothetical protein BDV93DRAFT_512867 [Ceratobasidium sp. AG-I]
MRPPSSGYIGQAFKPNAASKQLSERMESNEALRKETEHMKNRYKRWTAHGPPEVTKIGCDLSKSLGELAVPNASTAGVTSLNPLSRGSLVVMRNAQRWYLGSVLGIYKRGSASGRHESYTNATLLQGLSYLSLKVYLQCFNLNLLSPKGDGNCVIYTHALASDLVYVLNGATLAPNTVDESTFSLSGDDNGFPRWKKITSSQHTSAAKSLRSTTRTRKAGA